MGISDLNSPAGGVTAPLTAATTLAGPCAPARAEVDAQCAEAERLVAAVNERNEELREVRLRYAEATQQRELDAALRDRRRLAEDKASAQAEYHAAVMRAIDRAGVQTAAAVWLRRIDELNRHERDANSRAGQLGARIAELEGQLPNMEMAADAARIRAESAQAACIAARHALAACEEAAGQFSTSASGAAWNLPTPEAPPPPAPAGSLAAAAAALAGGDRQTFLGLALRLTEETGIEAGRLQLLLLELREQIWATALDNLAIVFPADHPFWSQFPGDAARQVVASLASMGYRFDGVGGWVDSRSPNVRDLSMAISYSGFDPRSLRRPAGQGAIDGLWQGATVAAEAYLLARAPDLSVSQLVDFLGPRSNRLSELWDIWGRMRPQLMHSF